LTEKDDQVIKWEITKIEWKKYHRL
jgi:hypothetical protein